MGIISLEKANHLFWLGRYVERVFYSIKLFNDYYDEMLDMDAEGYKKYCKALEIPDIYDSKTYFIRNYMRNIDNPDSLAANLQRAYDNAVVLRDEITSDTLAYIQMAVDSLQRGTNLKAPMVEMVAVIDNLLAFWGSVDENVSAEEVRNMMKCGKYIERLDLNIRLKAEDEIIERTYSKLMNRLKRVHISLAEDSVNALAISMAERNSYNGAVYSVNNIFKF